MPATQLFFSAFKRGAVTVGATVPAAMAAHMNQVTYRLDGPCYFVLKLKRGETSLSDAPVELSYYAFRLLLTDALFPLIFVHYEISIVSGAAVSGMDNSRGIRIFELPLQDYVPFKPSAIKARVDAANRDDCNHGLSFIP